jgi:hypothetical protein
LRKQPRLAVMGVGTRCDGMEMAALPWRGDGLRLTVEDRWMPNWAFGAVVHTVFPFVFWH